MDAITGYLLDTESEMYGVALAALGELGSLGHKKELGASLDRKKVMVKGRESDDSGATTSARPGR